MTTAAATERFPPARLLPAAAPLVLTFAAVAALLWLVTNVSQREWPSPDIDLTYADEHYRVPPPQLELLQSFSSLHFSEGEHAARRFVADEVDARLDAIFMQAGAHLPEFLDWYYSLGGEYSRIAMAALSLANLAEPDYVAAQAAAMLLPDDTWSEGIEALQREADAGLRVHAAHLREGWLDEMIRRLSPHRVPAPLSASASRGDAASRPALELQSMMQAFAAREQAALEMRMSLSTVAGVGAAGPVLWRAVSRRSSALAARAAAARVATRGAARAGSAAAGGALLCAPGGAAALGCGLIAGAATWIGADWALLRVDEQLHRKELEAGLQAGLQSLREQTERELLSAYDAMITRHYGQVQQDITDTFVPARSGAE